MKHTNLFFFFSTKINLCPPVITHTNQLGSSLKNLDAEQKLNVFYFTFFTQMLNIQLKATAVVLRQLPNRYLFIHAMCILGQIFYERRTFFHLRRKMFELNNVHQKLSFRRRIGQIRAKKKRSHDTNIK